MNQTMARGVIGGMLIVAGGVWGQEAQVSVMVGTPAPAVWELPDNPLEKVPVECGVRIPGFELKPGEHGDVAVLPGRIPGVDKPGAPVLPALATGFKGHPQVRLAARFVGSEFEDIPDVDMAPVPSVRAGEFDQPYAEPVKTYSKAADYYTADAWWPETLVALQEAMMGTQKFVRVECRPFQYNAARKTLRFHKQIDFVLEVKHD
jgi:hypothetical protein